MERFEVALILDERRLLVPSMLPRDKPGLHLADLGEMFSSGKWPSSAAEEVNSKHPRNGKELQLNKIINLRRNDIEDLSFSKLFPKR